MTPFIPLRRIFAAAAVAAAALAAVVPTHGVGSSSPKICGLTTLDGTIVADPAHPGQLKCGPALTVKVREDLGAKAKATRVSIRDALASFAAFTDFQLSDEESPLRAEFLDKCEAAGTRNPFRAAFRLQETMLPQLINAEIQTANAIAAGPATHRPFDFAVQLGDAADNQQFNEVRWFMTLLDGSADPQGHVHLVNPDSGADKYEGVQARDPVGSPAHGITLRDLANEPFYAAGLRKPDGSGLPWYSVLGNHDAKVQGTMPNNDAWKTFARAWVTGDLKVADLAPDDQERLCADPALLTDPTFWQEIALSSGTKLITADPNRRLLDRNQWIAEHMPPAKAKQIDSNAVGSYGLPAGHGFEHRCTDASGTALARACYSFDLAPDATLPVPIPLHFIALDTTDDAGLDDGNIDQAEWDWLQRDLVTHSSSYYDEGGTKKATTNSDSLVVVFSHHTESTMTNSAPGTSEKRYNGSDLQSLFHRFGNVILHANGHTHFNKVWAHPDPSGNTGGYWEVNTSSIADWPHESRTIEIADNHDGTISIIGVNFDAAVPPNARGVNWSADQTPESAMRSSIQASGEREAVKANSNETWLASAAREAGYNDPQSGARASYAAEATADDALDKDVELIVRNPLGVTPARTTAAAPSPFPGFPRGFPPFAFRPPTFQRPPFPFTPPEAPNQFPRSFGRTGPGLGSPHNRPYIPAEESVLILAAIFGAAWLYRARIRAWMLGR